MMNDFENIPAESEFRVDMTISTDEGELPIDQDTPLGQLLGDGEDNDCRNIEPDLTAEEITEQQLAREEELEAQGWPGDGSGTDDLADFNANEAADYSNE